MSYPNSFILHANNLAQTIQDSDASSLDMLFTIMEKLKSSHPNLLYTVISPKCMRILVRYTGNTVDSNNKPIELTDEEKECRSLMIQYIPHSNTFELVYSQFEKIKTENQLWACSEQISADDGMPKSVIQKLVDVIQDPTKKKIYEYCYDGTMITTIWSDEHQKFVHYTRSRDAYDSYWHNISYGEMFNEALEINGITFDIDDEFYEKDCHYFNVLVSHKNKNVADYSNVFGENYNKVVFVAKRKNGTIDDMVVDDAKLLSLGFMLSKKLNFNGDIDVMVEYLNNLDIESYENRKILHEGIIIKTYETDKRYDIYKLQTNEYKKLKTILPNTSNIWIKYLELYRKNLLKEYIDTYDINADKNTLKIINNSFSNLTTELTKIYFKTRNGNNSSLYKTLPKSFHQALYDIHGIYLNKKSNAAAEDNIEIANTPITAMDVNNYLRTCDVNIVAKLIIEREYLIKNLPEQYCNIGLINNDSVCSQILANNFLLNTPKKPHQKHANSFNEVFNK